MMKINIYSFSAKEKKGIEYSIDHDLEQSSFIILNNNDNAIDFKISYIEENKKQAGYEKYPNKNWKILISHKKGVLITDFADLKEFLIFQELKDGLTKSEIHK